MIQSATAYLAEDSSSEDKPQQVEAPGADTSKAAASLADVLAKAPKPPAPEPLKVGPPLPDPLDLDAAISVPWLRDFIRGIAEQIQFDPSAVALWCLGILAGSACKGWRVHTGEWEEELQLWTMVLANPGERKSPMFAKLIGPVETWQADEAKALATAIQQREDRRDVIGKRLKAKKDLAAICTEAAERTKLEAELAMLREDFETLVSIASPELLTATPTPEGLLRNLRRSGGKAILATDEIDSTTLLGSRYSEKGAPNIDTLLHLHNGGNVRATRKTEDGPPVIGACGAIVIGTQPAAVEDLMRNPIARDRGLLDRFLPCMVRSKMGARGNHPPACPHSLIDRWFNTVRGLLEKPWEGRPVLHAGELAIYSTAPAMLRMSPESLEQFDGLRASLEMRLRPDGDLRPLSGFASKLAGTIARIAAVLALAADRGADEVDAASMKAALEWAPWLIAQTRFVRGLAGESPELRHARRTVETLRRKGLLEVSARDLFGMVETSDLNSMQKAKPVFDLLLERGILEELPAPERQQGQGGRTPSPRYRFHDPDADRRAAA